MQQLPGSPLNMATYKAKTFSELIFQAKPTDKPWQNFNLSPHNRTLYPTRVHRVEGTVRTPQNLCSRDGIVPPTSPEGALFTSANALVTLDFGVNTCGIVTINFGRHSSSQTTAGLAFSESKLFVGRDSDKSVDFAINDGHLTIEVSGQGQYTVPADQQRGAFRYVTLYHKRPRTGDAMHVLSVSTNVTMMPSLPNLREYSGFFHCSDDFLNQIWYAGAYTIQLSTVDSNSGRRIDHVMAKTGWKNDAQVSNGLEVLCDGAKRDRSVWSGDRLISTPSDAVAFCSDANRNAVEWIFIHQLEDGRLPYACKPVDLYGSDSYHLWGLLAVYEAWQAGGRTQWIRQFWSKYRKGLQLALSWIDSNYGLARIVGPLDWGRQILKGHNMAVNCLLYAALVCGVEMGQELEEDPECLSDYVKTADNLREAINDVLWSEKDGMYRDCVDSTVFPQDGNSLAIYYGVADTERARKVSEQLTRRWNEFGAVSPESPGMISAFIGSIELHAHFLAGRPNRALALLRTMWGYMWRAPYSVKSSLIEGYYKDGTCQYPYEGYDASYISHCHPWATGPTSFLTHRVSGLKFTTPHHSEWILKPEIDLTGIEFALAGFTSPLKGYIVGGWKRDSRNLLQVAIKAPLGTIGTICIPLIHGRQLKMTLDGVTVPMASLDIDERFAYIANIPAGNHTVYAWYLD